MRRAPVRISVACVMFALFASSSARAGDFVDLRLSFNVTDENVLVTPGETEPSIPGPRIGAPIPEWGQFFFDNYDTRYTGFENLTHLVLYKRIELGQEEFEGAFVLSINALSQNTNAFYDGGSYLTWRHWLDPTRESHANVSFTAFPLSSDRMRLGFSYKISWGGSPTFFAPNPDNPFASVASSNPNPVPGARLQYATDRAYAWLGAKTSLWLNTAINEQTTIWGLLGGGGLDFTSMLRLEGNGGVFYRGANPIQQVLGQPVYLWGGTLQASVHKGVPVGQSLDYKLYRNDPTSAMRFFEPESYPGGFTWLISSEFTATGQTLEDADNPNSTKIQPGYAGDVNVRAKINYLRLHMDIMYRDLSFLLLNVPSFVPFQALSESAKTTPEGFVSVGADYFLTGPKLTVGLTTGVDFPATFSGQLPAQFLGNIPPEALPRSTTVVVREEGLYDILPPGASVSPVYATKITAILQRGSFDILAELLFAVDGNQTHLVRVDDDPTQVQLRVYTEPYQLGFNIAFQAKL